MSAFPIADPSETVHRSDSRIGFRIAMTAGLCLSGIRIFAQEKIDPSRPAAAAAASSCGAVFSGYLECEQCHDSQVKKRADIDYGLGYKGPRPNAWIEGNEYSIWVKGLNEKNYETWDKHVQAFKVLSQGRARKMAERLGIPPDDIQRDKRCLACHSGYPLPATNDKLLSKEFVENRDVSFGVTCEGCHGPSGGAPDGGVPKEWLTRHFRAGSRSDELPWRYQSSKSKERDFCFTDVRTPSGKVRLCLSCHLGSVSHSRVLTHEMYGAGHPPLSGFELETFCEHMPAHWTPLRRKDAQVIKDYIQRTQDTVFKGDLQHPPALLATKAVMVGGLVALSESVKLTSEICQSGDVVKKLGVHWPELAQFECYACHHDLQNEGWRQKRTSTGPPGRPMLRTWPFSLAEIVVEVYQPGDKSFQQSLGQLQEVVGREPFGDANEIPRPASAAVEQLTKLAEKIQDEPMTRVTAESFRRRLCEVAAKRWLDYDSARQVIWALRIVNRELAGDGGQSPDAIAQAVEKLDRDGVLVLNPKIRTEPPESNTPRVNSADLSRQLAPIGKYDPVLIHDVFGRLREALQDGGVDHAK